MSGSPSSSSPSPSSPSPSSPSPSSLPPGNNNFIKRRIIKWLFFNILFALIPLAYRFLKLCIFNSCDNPLNLLYKKGELLLISTAILAESIGELNHTEYRYKTVSLMLVGFSFLAIILTTNMFTDIDDFSKGDVVARWSFSIFFTSIVIGATGKILGRD